MNKFILTAPAPLLKMNFFLGIFQEFCLKVSEDFFHKTLLLIFAVIVNKLYTIFLYTGWLPTTSILVVIGRIYCYQFKCNYLKNQQLFVNFRIYINFEHFEEKKEPHSLNLLKLLTPKDELT